ncbi:glycoside hydrolase family 93 protein [Stipitochalara longipes BDJ]|nr:glycoside hydrolase family 93 protein [Stipitochalara longipes BDJ]
MALLRRIAVGVILIVTMLLLFRRNPRDEADFLRTINAKFLAQYPQGQHHASLSESSSPKMKSPYLNSTTGRVMVPRLVGRPASIYPPAGMQTYPRAIKLRSGVLLAASTIFTPEHSISLSISMDSGNSWAPYSTVVKTPSQDIQLNNAFLLELPSGRLLCAFRAHTQALSAIGAEEKPGGQNEGYLYYRLMIYYSDDAGETWQHLSTPAQEPGPSHGNWEPFLRLSNSGVLQFYYSRELGGRDQDNLMRVSHDEGLSWSDAQVISGPDLESRDGMLGLQEITPGSGHLVAVFESVEEKGDGPFFEERNAGAPQIALVGKTLVVSFMTDEDKLEGMWHRNAYVKIITSADKGATWGNKLLVAEKPAAWAGLLALNETSFLVLCDHENRSEAQQVALV